jgi:mRNA-degrading endonuclease YafQ of YafQ-DinJ toxin-antitoxin module
MRIDRAESFKKDFNQLPAYIQRLFEKKIRLFMQNAKHPSLRVKKMQGHENRWEASINMFYRFTFEVHTDRYLFRRIGPHDEVLKKP